MCANNVEFGARNRLCWRNTLERIPTTGLTRAATAILGTRRIHYNDTPFF